MRIFVFLLILVFCISCYGFTEKEFKIDQLKAMVGEVRNWKLDNPKLLILYRELGGSSVSDILSENDRKYIVLELLKLADELKTEDKKCLCDTILFHDTGDYEIHKLLGGYQLIYHRDLDKVTVYVEKDGKRIELE